MNTPEFPFPFSLFMKYFWILAIGTTFLNAFILKARSRKYVEKNPSLEEGYEKLFRGYIFYMNIPWVVLGIGMIFGGFNSIFEIFFGFGNGNIFALLFFGTVALLWILSIIWIYFLKGAEFLVDYPGVFNTNIQSPLMIKILATIMLVGGILGLISIIRMNW